MVIQSSNIGMRSERYYRKREEEVKSLQLWGTSKNGQDELQMGNALKEGGVDAKEIAEAKNTVKSSRNIQKQEDSELKKSIHQIQAEAIQYLLDLFFGDGKGKHTALGMLGQTNAQAFGGSYQEISYYSEEETTSFQTEGTVKTADGREMSFQIKVEMSRSFTSYMEKRVDFGAARLCDPLVINLNSSTAQVTDQKFYFDLDADGTADRISMLKSGSGFLALDKNGNGKIDDGSELFGTQSGDGFADLEEYDIDKNGWIDEADEIFDKLRIWVRDENGNDRLIKLKEAGVGAICLKNADTQFSLNSRYSNRTNAYIRKTGIFLYENGGVGTVQHLDLAQ